jgi:hypothetical protein
VEAKTTDELVPRKIAALLSSERLILRDTKRAVTPLGGVAVFVAFLRKIDLSDSIVIGIDGVEKVHLKNIKDAELAYRLIATILDPSKLWPRNWRPCITSGGKSKLPWTNSKLECHAF